MSVAIFTACAVAFVGLLVWVEVTEPWWLTCRIEEIPSEFRRRHLRPIDAGDHWSATTARSVEIERAMRRDDGRGQPGPDAVAALRRIGVRPDLAVYAVAAAPEVAFAGVARMPSKRHVIGPFDGVTRTAAMSTVEAHLRARGR